MNNLPLFVSESKNDTESVWGGMPWAKIASGDPGERCPHCDRFLKTYNRRIIARVGVGLIRLYQLSIEFPDRRYFHVTDIKGASFGGDFAKLRFYGLIKEMPNDDVEKKSSGKWEITELGIAFVENRLQVPKYCVIKWNSEHIGFAGEMVGIRTVIEYRNQFNYQQLMYDNN